MALAISGTGNGSLNNLALSASTGDILDSANTTFFGVDMWRLPSTLSGPNGVLTTLERVDDASYGRIGTGMTESSGIFTFPSTGIYLVLGQCEMYFAAYDSVAVVQTEVTQDNSSYDIVARAGAGGTNSENYCSYSQALVDVTDVSNVKVRFNAVSYTNSNSQLNGNTDQNLTCFSFIRMGDT